MCEIHENDLKYEFECKAKDQDFEVLNAEYDLFLDIICDVLGDIPGRVFKNCKVEIHDSYFQVYDEFENKLFKVNR